MRKRRTCFEQTLPEDCEDFFRKGGPFGRKSSAEILICAMHQYGASVPSISTDDRSIHAGITRQPCRVARGGRPTHEYIAVQQSEARNVTFADTLI
jgi:hypothetical protein